MTALMRGLNGSTTAACMPMLSRAQPLPHGILLDLNERLKKPREVDSAIGKRRKLKMKMKPTSQASSDHVLLCFNWLSFFAGCIMLVICIENFCVMRR
jgi:hypothetical protein